VRPKASWAGLICRTCLHLKRQTVTIWLVTATSGVICVTCIVQTQIAFSKWLLYRSHTELRTLNSELRPKTTTYIG